MSDIIQPPEPSLPALVKTTKPKKSGLEISFNMDESQAPVSLDIMSNFLAKDGKSNMTSLVQREGGVVYNKEQSGYPLSKQAKE